MEEEVVRAVEKHIRVSSEEHTNVETLPQKLKKMVLFTSLITYNQLAELQHTRMEQIRKKIVDIKIL